MLGSRQQPLSPEEMRLLKLLDAEETDENCQALRDYIAGLGTGALEHTMRIPRVCWPTGIKERLRAFVEDTMPPGRLLITVTPAAAAIDRGKPKFFEILVDACPKVIYMTGTPDHKIDAPLVIAINNRSVPMACTVLCNIHFLHHEFQGSLGAIVHINECNSLIRGIYPPYENKMSEDEAKISQMLYSVYDHRIDLISLIKNCEEVPGASSIRFKLLSEAFVRHKEMHPDIHKMILESCLTVAENWCFKAQREEVCKLLSAELDSIS